jgi:twitching motility protein PilT
LIEIERLLDLVVTQNCSDLHLTVGRPPVVRHHGRLRDVNMPPLSPDDTIALMKEITPPRNLEELKKKGGTDFAYAFSDRGRFRVSVFQQKGRTGMALRLIPNKLMSFEEIGLPPVVRDICDRPRGLVLVTGPTGSGKTTTLATMIDYINRSQDRHIVTIEDPIEYYHEHSKSIITQREIGNDVGSFPEAMRRVLRQDPDVILLGEMRDLETIMTAITAAETGHLVMATLHTTGSARTVDRIIDQFPVDQQETIRVQLSVSVIAVISQVIMPRADNDGLIAGFEVMVMTSAIENHIRKNETFKITSSIQTSRNLGMVLMDDFLWGLWRDGKITQEEMFLKCQNPRTLREKLELFEASEEEPQQKKGLFKRRVAEES